MAQLSAKQRIKRQSRALIAAFFAIYFLSYSLVHPVLGPDTVYLLLADLSLALSLSGNAAQLALFHIITLVVGLIFTTVAFATFASYGGNLLLSLLGIGGLCFTAGILSGTQVAAALAVYLVIQALLHHGLNARADCKQMLLLSTLSMLFLMLLTLNASIVRHGGALTVGALREGLTATALRLAAAYQETVPALQEIGALQQLPNYQAPMLTDQAVLYVINYLPAIMGVAAMLCAFFFTAWFRRADGRHPPRLGLVIDEYEVTPVAAGLYVAASLLAFLAPGMAGLTAMQYLIVMTLPLSIQGVASIRRNTRETGRGLPLLILILLFFTATPSSILLFFALIGSLDRLIPRRLFKKEE